VSAQYPGPQGAVSLELREVEKRYGAAVALGPISLAVPAARTIAVLGPSGCGKSTLLRVLIGLVRADRGEVRIGGEALRDETLRAHRLRTGYVIQEGGLFPHWTAGENAAVMARELGWPAARTAARLAELFALVGLPPELAARHPAELSGGQRQRVGLVRALFLDPALLLLDEPLGALDPIARRRLQDDLRAIFHRLGKTVVLVTHDFAEAAFLSEEIVLLRAGRIVQRGTARDLVERPADPFVTEFVSAQRPALAAGVGS
jgi:osmoprotectant transport system ATP-binding protein